MRIMSNFVHAFRNCHEKWNNANVNTEKAAKSVRVSPSPILAWRHWELWMGRGRPWLVSGHMRGVWERAEEEACHIPNEGNSCGLYAYSVLERDRIPLMPPLVPLSIRSIRSEFPVMGAVSLSGVVIEHEDGVLRAQYAKIEELWIPEIQHEGRTMYPFLLTRKEALQAGTDYRPLYFPPIVDGTPKVVPTKSKRVPMEVAGTLAEELGVRCVPLPVHVEVVDERKAQEATDTMPFVPFTISLESGKITQWVMERLGCLQNEGAGVLVR